MNTELTLNDTMKAKMIMDNHAVPTVGRYLYDTNTEELMRSPPAKHFSLKDLKNIFPIK